MKPNWISVVWSASLLGVLSQGAAWSQSHFYFRKASAGFELGQGDALGSDSVKEWNGPFPDTAVRLDEELRKLAYAHRASGLHVHLGAGTWKTLGMSPRGNPGLLQNNDPFFGLSGLGIETTTLRLENNAPYDACEGFLNVISNAGAGYTRRLQLNDLTIDCNWEGQNTVVSSACPTHPNRCQDTRTRKGEAGYKCGFKLGGVSMNCTYAIVERVRVLRFGANGLRPTRGAGTEAFGISITTGNFGQEGTPVIIRNCEVGQFRHFNGGYCTAIMVVTLDPTTLHLQRPRGSWPDFSAQVVSNKVFSLEGGIGYGCAYSEQVRFFRNQAEQSQIGFNCDASDPRPNEPTRNIVLESNLFTNVFQGINIGSSGHADPRTVKFQEFFLLNNRVHLLGDSAARCWLGTEDDPPICGWVGAYGVRLHGATAKIHLSNNRFSAVAKNLWIGSKNEEAPPPAYVPIRVIQSAEYRQAPGCDCLTAQPTFNREPIVDTPNYSSRLSGAFGYPALVEINSPVLVP